MRPGFPARFSRSFLSALTSIVPLLLAACAGDDGPTDPGSETLASLAVTPLGIVEPGRPIDLLVEAVGSRGTRPFPYDGAVTLTADRGTVTPAGLLMGGGTARSSIQLSASDSTVTMTASVDAGAATGSAPIHLSPVAILPGGSGALVDGMIPAVDFIPRPGDYRTGHPEFPDARISFNTLTVVFAPGTTVGEANALLTPLQPEIAGGYPGVPGSIPGILVLRVPSLDHGTMTAMIDRLTADPRIAIAVQDEAIDTDVQPGDGPSIHGTWAWETTPSGGNWGLEMCRVPALWNFNPAVEKAGTGNVSIGMLDTGQFLHDDFDVGRVLRLNSGFEGTHGTHVAGTMIATFDNRLGMEGVHPWATLRTMADSTFSYEWQRNAIRRILDAAPNTQVINISLGTRWNLGTFNPGSSPISQARLNIQGTLADIFLQLERTRGRTPVLCVSAGNASANASIGVVDAMWNSQWTNAALARNVEQILVIENVQQDPADATATTRAASSNINGFLAAPGQNILSTWSGNGYRAISGTSMASPLVAGTVGYLRALEPSLTVREIRQVLFNTAVTSGGGASDRLDAFGAALEIDGIRDGDAIVRRLLDIDDGTVDGNRRIAFDSSSDYTGEDADGDGGIGDGVIDMSDFRRWRDWYLVTQGTSGLSLDGSQAHAKKDVNGNGFEDPPADENVWPRGDFNGDGQLSLTARVEVPGFFAGAEKTDLEMLQALFDDPDVSAADLDNLIESADVDVDLSGFLGSQGSTTARIRILDGVTEAVHAERIVSSAADEVVITVPTGFSLYRAVVEGLDGGGTAVCTYEKDFPLAPGEDVYLRPACVRLEIEADFPLAVEAGTPAPLGITVYRRNDQGGRDPAPGVSVSLLATGGTVTPSSGVTNGAGALNAQATLIAPATNITVFITATDPGTGGDVTTSVSADAFVPGGRAIARSSQVDGRAEAHARTDDDTQSTTELGPPFGTHDISHTAEAGDMGVTAQASAAWQVQIDVDSGTDELRRISFDGSIQAAGNRAEVNGEMISGCGSAGCGFQVILDVVEAPVSYSFRGTIDPAHEAGDVRVRIREGLQGGGWAFPHLFDSETSFDTTGQLPVGTYMVQVWCQTTACGNTVNSDDAALSGSFEILGTP